MTEKNISVLDVELFLIKNLKEHLLGDKKHKLEAECSLAEFLLKFEEFCKQL